MRGTAIIEDPDAKATDEGSWKVVSASSCRGGRGTVTMPLDADLLDRSVADAGYRTRHRSRSSRRIWTPNRIIVDRPRRESVGAGGFQEGRGRTAGV